MTRPDRAHAHFLSPLNGRPPAPAEPPLSSATSAHLPTLEVLRRVLQERVEKSEEELAHRLAHGVSSPYGEGYVGALNHVLDLLAVMSK